MRLQSQFLLRVEQLGNRITSRPHCHLAHVVCVLQVLLVRGQSRCVCGLKNGYSEVGTGTAVSVVFGHAAVADVCRQGEPVFVSLWTLRLGLPERQQCLPRSRWSLLGRNWSKAAIFCPRIGLYGVDLMGTRTEPVCGDRTGWLEHFQL